MADVSRGRAFLKLAALVGIIVTGLALVRLTPVGGYLGREGIESGIQTLRGSTWAPLVFIAVYAIATALAIPGTILTLAGGALFGVFWGTIFNSVAANLGANAAFLEARLLGRDGLERLLGGRLARLDRATRAHGFRGLLILRLVPLVPFNALNFGSGLTAISWLTYVIATAVGILPGTIVYTFFADALLQGSQDASREAFSRMLLAGALLVLLSLLPVILKKLKIRLPGAVGLLALTVPAFAGGQTIPDHDALTAVLRSVVEHPGVDYSKLQKERAALDAYLEELHGTDAQELASAAPDVQLAFWINAYNACMLRRVIDHYPIQKSTGLLGSIRNRLSDRPQNSVWQIRDVFTEEACPVAGELRSQDEIEHEIIRPMGDPRIHFAVNCAARSCPPLMREAYVPDRLGDQLDARIRAFVSDPRQFRVDGSLVRLNKVLDWYKEDFGGEEGVLELLSRYVSPDMAEQITASDVRVTYFEYDWTLNDVER